VAPNRKITLPTRTIRWRDHDVNTVESRGETRLDRPLQIARTAHLIRRTSATARQDSFLKEVVPEVLLLDITVLILVSNDLDQ
jgi:hypothetical protein